MLAQATKTPVQPINASQSLAAVQTMLRAGLSCITFLRNLLPDENFTESHFTTADDSPLSSRDSDTSSCSSRLGRNINSFKIMTMTRGYSVEADKILDYLEHGIFHALQKQYLRSFIFAIYLDSNNPNNIVEAYTFNFHYHTICGTDVTVPIMTFGDNFEQSSLKKKGLPNDAVTEAAKRGRCPSLKEVKRSVKTLLKTLIHATTQMDLLPKKRFATFKLFYTDQTPADYEPPCFQAGDAEKDKWYLMTHEIEEVPDKWNIGKMHTGYHSVNLSIASIATYLPSSAECSDAIFTGTTSQIPVKTTLTPIQEAQIRAQDMERQNQDAETRNVVWSAEDNVELTDLDAEGDDDPDYIRLPDGTYKPIDISLSEPMFPVGIRNETGEIVPLNRPGDETIFGGASETIPTRLEELNVRDALEPNIEHTQDLDSNGSQNTRTATADFPSDSISSLPLASMSQPATVEENEGHEIDTLMLSKMSIDDTSLHSGMGNAIPDISSDTLASVDPISSCSTLDKADAIESANLSLQHSNDAFAMDNGLKCDCGIQIEDACCFCEGNCRHWYHIWCMGYHAVKDDRIPARFICFDCRLRVDPAWELIKLDLYPLLRSRYVELALFRRAIKVAETRKVESLSDFVKGFGGDKSVAHQMHKRLETEGFLIDLNVNQGLPMARSRNQRKPAKTRKALKRSRYGFNCAIKATEKYLNYFKPDPEVEGRLLGLLELKKKIDNIAAPPSGHEVRSSTLEGGYSQTQVETQDYDTGQKRPSAGLMSTAEESTRPTKKVKISIAFGLDLAE